MNKNSNDESKKTKTEPEIVSPSQEDTKKKPALKEQVGILKQEIEDLKDKKLRIAAEFENFRRRSFQEKADWIKNATERLILELCDVRDNFERALDSENKQDGDSFKKGIEMIFQQLESVLKNEGLTKIEAKGKDFDPQYHEALAHIPSELEENKIVAIIQNGYLMNDKVIRAVRVAVSNGEKPKKKKDEQRALPRHSSKDEQ